MQLKDKKIVVFGLARSGAGAANLLAAMGADVTVTDKKSRHEIAEFADKLLPAVKLVLGGHPDSLFKGVDLIVVSPGVPLKSEPLQKAKASGIKIIGELELSYQTIKGRVPFYVITGTNGKSTTTTLLGMMFRKSGFKTIVGGNIGNALTEEIFKLFSRSAGDTDSASETRIEPGNKISAINSIVAEVSNFQLESIETFRPKGAAILNITPDHLDRYNSMEEYADAKAQVFLNQRQDDFLVLNADDAATISAYENKRKARGTVFPEVFFFSRIKKVKGVYVKDGTIYSSISLSKGDKKDIPLLAASDICIKGVHNLENAMAASAMALLAQCPEDAVTQTLKEFPGLEHRLEFVREFEGVTYINDSKGTNIGAVMKSLESFSEPVVLIAGGRDKAGDFKSLMPFVKDRVKTLVLIGEAKEKIKKALGNIVETLLAESLEEAVAFSRKSASRGDVVLLSPACASFDMFRDFEDRGEQFKNIVRRMS